MIDIFRGSYDSEINFFYGRAWVERNEIALKEKTAPDGKKYLYAEPAEPGSYAFGGTLLYTSNGIYPEFNTPIKLHDRQMNLEV